MSQNNKTDEKFWRASNPIAWGIVASGVVFAVGLIMAFLPACHISSGDIISCPNKWFYLMQSTPNELGDTLAGFAGTWAFIWIIVTVSLQSIELSEQRKVLIQQREATQKMAAAQEEQVKLLVQQGEIFAKEQTQRNEFEAQEYLDELIRTLIGDTYALWEFQKWKKSIQNSTNIISSPYIRSGIQKDPDGPIEQVYRQLFEDSVRVTKSVQDAHDGSRIALYPPKPSVKIGNFLRLLSLAIETKDRLSPKSKIRFERMQIQKHYDILKIFFENPDYWNPKQ